MADQTTEVMGTHTTKETIALKTALWTQQFVIGDAVVAEMLTRNPIIIDSDLHPSHRFYKNVAPRRQGTTTKKFVEDSFLVSANHIYLDKMTIITYLKASR